ncbi:SDR family oxidoreductase [Hydrogenophaga sp.]|uniref:SDR family NAD(P)-dependent oxidoreductase n=1 Tax=Hydrogenophaga sp. TaxID=1904254 RepID=UPI00271D319E|nr:SDR family NAD(P)-dependent oxidoreductase [Hydrogenophaga sp.]MDZ4359510.1 SDR family NAD(P)-dependent oxidoreductase [Variovorax sp.]MDO9253835.1 SDR family NAD(P)-dependent oxidoreductase [Hydrogenophaga sp.]MDP2406777.1 SDR family NAD(P)-dependent oxidoreductase [Hydrogenophaga sp.]MDP3326092.1 SDR family NAD(P)-dependent oxidoreductase [Hydrogenophaga sp.]MDP3886711.1 SDR family NAD(P)-dependent oxidoreductase [Hydrogenophaga sp.]
MTLPLAFVEKAPDRSPPAIRPPHPGWSLLKPFNPPITDWRGLRVWVIGASSGIGLATAEALIERGASVQVSARGAAALERLVAQHTRTGTATPVQAWPLDVTDTAAVAATARAVLAQGPLDLVLYCAGHYREMRATEFDLGELQQHLAINYSGALNVLDAVLPGLIARGSGHISLISSVAGFRGLPKSLAYGPTKAALTHLAETLYLDLEPLGLGVSVVHPGFVQTPLTAQNNFSMPSLITPEQAAAAMLNGWARGAFDIHYPKRFTRWMKLLRLLPYRAYFPAVRRFTGL